LHKGISNFPEAIFARARLATLALDVHQLTDHDNPSQPAPISPEPIPMSTNFHIHTPIVDPLYSPPSVCPQVVSSSPSTSPGPSPLARPIQLPCSSVEADVQCTTRSCHDGCWMPIQTSSYRRVQSRHTGPEVPRVAAGCGVCRPVAC